MTGSLYLGACLFPHDIIISSVSVLVKTFFKKVYFYFACCLNLNFVVRYIQFEVRHGKKEKTSQNKEETKRQKRDNTQKKDIF